MNNDEQKIKDSLSYLNKVKSKDSNFLRGVQILRSIFSSKSKHPEIENLRLQISALAHYAEGKGLAIIIGHEKFGGAKGEWSYNQLVATHIDIICSEFGIDNYTHTHKLKAYTARQKAMAEAVKKNQPSNFVCTELHYDAVDDATVNGHHYQYRGAKDLAQHATDIHSETFPQSKKRQSAGIKYNVKGNGAGFLRISPGWAMLTEPFFITNKNEAEFYKNKHKTIALMNVLAFLRFCKTIVEREKK